MDSNDVLATWRLRRNILFAIAVIAILAAIIALVGFDYPYGLAAIILYTIGSFCLFGGFVCIIMGYVASSWVYFAGIYSYIERLYGLKFNEINNQAGTPQNAVERNDANQGEKY